MAKTTITKITDDLDGTKDAAEVSFSFDGTDHTIDLSKKNIAAFEKALKPYIDAATKVSASTTTTRRSRKKSASGTRQDYSQIREWARKQGITVSDRGRIPASVLEQYEAAK
ncbi:Lsr2 family protein [Nocardioides sp.]|uniref:histone-like nucleoid-structuring protein Lsr2 n=1 Tax=Nocardioides sp. TaxID=35761 RepID=UPI00271C25EA|nr:Lsr2 family protein [Nocardioides sp.]MDO9455240.1 Lsr2 family protein [Nocardioides sp.]